MSRGLMEKGIERFLFLTYIPKKRHKEKWFSKKILGVDPIFNLGRKFMERPEGLPCKTQGAGRETQGKEIDLLETLIRKTYHDGVNIFGPLREIISLKFESSLGTYVINNFTYYLSLLKNLRFVYLLRTSPTCLKETSFEIGEFLEGVLFEEKNNYRSEEKESLISSSLRVRGPQEAIGALFSNLLANAFRFGEEIWIRMEGSRVIIKNTVGCPLCPDADSIYDLPVAYDKFGILGAGIGLKIVKEVSDFLEIDIEDEVGEDYVEVRAELANIVDE